MYVHYSRISPPLLPDILVLARGYPRPRSRISSFLFEDIFTRLRYFWRGYRGDVKEKTGMIDKNSCASVGADFLILQLTNGM